MSPIGALYDAYLRKEPRQARSRSMVESILDAASNRLRSVDTDEEVSVQSVAQDAGVGIGSLYDYFRDRKSLLAALVAKLTEENVRRFEAELGVALALPLEASVEHLMDVCLRTYTVDKRVSRAVLRIAYSVGLMPVLVRSQTAFVASLGAALRKHPEVTARDVDLTAWVATQAFMGVVHTLVWEDEPRHSQAELRREIVRTVTAYLRAA